MINYQDFDREKTFDNFLKVHEEGNIEKTLKSITNDNSDKLEVLLITGSVFIMKDVRKFFQYEDELD